MSKGKFKIVLKGKEKGEKLNWKSKIDGEYTNVMTALAHTMIENYISCGGEKESFIQNIINSYEIVENEINGGNE